MRLGDFHRGFGAGMWGGGSPIDETSGQPKYFCMGKPNCFVKFKLCLSYLFHICHFFSLKFVYQFGCQFKKMVMINL